MSTGITISWLSEVYPKLRIVRESSSGETSPHHSFTELLAPVVYSFLPDEEPIGIWFAGVSGMTVQQATVSQLA